MRSPPSFKKNFGEIKQGGTVSIEALVRSQKIVVLQGLFWLWHRSGGMSNCAQSFLSNVCNGWSVVFREGTAMILVSLSPTDSWQCRGLTLEVKSGRQFVVRCVDSPMGVEDSTREALAGGYVRAELHLGTEDPFNKMVKLVAGQDGFELLAKDIPRSQGGWTD